MYLATNRPGPLAFARLDVSAPATRDAGTLDYSGGGRFALSSTAPLDAERFLAALAQGGPADAPLGLFVHGYNNNIAEAVYRHAQMTLDFDQPGPQVTFAWPSQGAALGYVADRDAALRSRDALDRLLRMLHRGQPRRIALIGHSMGGFLVMETLRQMAAAGANPADMLEAVVLISPDVDIGLFRAQARAIGRLPDPFLVTISDRDRALGLSAQLAGRRARLGAPDDLSTLADLDITVIDLSAARGGLRGQHLQAMSSPEAIRWLASIARHSPSLSARDGLDLIRLGHTPSKGPGTA